MSSILGLTKNRSHGPTPHSRTVRAEKKRQVQAEVSRGVRIKSLGHIVPLESIEYGLGHVKKDPHIPHVLILST